MTDIFWGFVLRLGQAAIDASLTLVIGVIVAGIFRRMIGPDGMRRLFGRGWKGLIRAWIAGMLLPVCALGVIPVARELRRAGVPGGTVLAFVLAAPKLNPISFLYGLTLAEPFVICCFVFASLTLSTLAGFMWTKLFARATDAAECKRLAVVADSEPLPAEGPRRILSVFVTAARELSGRNLVYYAIGLVGTALLATVIPFGSLQHTMRHDDPTSPLLMAAIAVPIYASPLQGMMKIGLMFEHGNSIGAAFVLFALGIGTCLGTLAWLVSDFGLRRILPWFLTYVGIVLAMAYIAEPLLFDTRKEQVDHTHAFDDYSCPFTFGTGSAAAVQYKLDEKFGPMEEPVVFLLVGMCLCGVTIRIVDRSGRLERWLTARNSVTGRTRPKWDITIPGKVLGGLALVGLVAFSVAGAYLYYPNREECFTEMFAVYADAAVAVTTGKKDEAIRELEQWDLIVRKLQVGVYIRTFHVTPEQDRTADELRDTIEEVRDFLRADNLDAARAKLEVVRTKYYAVRDAYRR